jgi:general secretion pathway protein K
MRAPHLRAQPRGRPKGRDVARDKRKQGFALLLSLVAIAILSVMITDLHETTGMGFAAANAQRDRMRAEYLAKSGVNLTRMLLGQEPALRKIVDGPYKILTGRRAPQIPVWQFADTILKPFADFEGSKEDISAAGYDMNLAQGLGGTGGTFEVFAVAENSKVNVNFRSLRDAASSQTQVAMLLYSLTGGYQPSPNKYDPLFAQFDERGRLTTRLDVIANVVDWWDLDDQHTQFDPALATTTSAGGEDTSYYSSLRDPYAIKNAPFDTLEEMRLVRGVNDDFWATFVEPNPEDPRARQVTIYGAGGLNPNEAEPAVMLARVCSFPELQKQLMCVDPTGAEPLKFMTLITFARSIAPIPWFSRGRDFMDFLSGKPEGLYGKLQSFAQTMGNAQMLFTPMMFPEDKDFLTRMRRSFTTRAEILTIEVTGRAGRAQTRLRTVVQRDPRWVPPPPNAGAMPPLGIFYYYRID